jgi:hypothetical protein
MKRTVIAAMASEDNRKPLITPCSQTITSCRLHR